MSAPDRATPTLAWRGPAANDPAASSPPAPAVDAAKIRACVHDLRNPAGAIGMAASLLRSTVEPLLPGLPAAQRALARTALAALAESVDQVRHLLDRISAELPAPLVDHAPPRGPVVEAFARPRPFDLAHVLRRLEVLVVTRAATPGLVHVEACEGLWVEGRTSELLRAFVNLVENALEAGARAGAADAWAGVRAYRDGDRVVVDVSNEGPAMPAEVRAYLEGRTQAPPASAGGNGIGTTVVRRVVEDHGGIVRVLRAGGRTTVRVGLPAAGAPPG